MDCIYLEAIAFPYLVIYAADDPLFEPQLIPELEQRINCNPYGYLILTEQGGHVSHIGKASTAEDEFWGLNRLLEFCEGQIYQFQIKD